MATGRFATYILIIIKGCRGGVNDKCHVSNALYLYVVTPQQMAENNGRRKHLLKLGTCILLMVTSPIVK